MSQQIENINIKLKNANKIDKLLQKEWAQIGINKKEKKTLQYKL